MKKFLQAQSLLITTLVLANLALLSRYNRIDLQEMVLFNLSLGLLYVALRSAIDLVRSKGLSEHFDEQI
jgi:hypothetical protein